MKINGIELDTEAGLIKARDGFYNDGLFRYSKNDYAIYIGGLKFPLAALNKFTPDMNGICKLLDNKFTIAIDNMLHTPNVISFEVEANLTEGQQASYTIQHGERSTVLTNLSHQKTTIVHEVGKPVIITAINYATGAITSRTVNPVTGQAYKLSSQSSTRVEGELKTIGGELVSGGELKTVCTQEGYNIDAAPIAYSGITATSLDRVNGNTGTGVIIDTYSKYIISQTYDSPLEAHNDFTRFYADVIGNQVALNYPYQGRKLCSEIIQSPLILVYGTERKDLLLGEPMELPVAGTYTIVREHPSNGDYIVLHFVTDTAGDKAVFYVSSRLLDNPVVEYAKETNTITADGVVTKYVNKAGAELQILNEVFIKNPLQKICLSQEIIDTRYSYTTPVITTDTRRTVHEIALTVTPLN